MKRKLWAFLLVPIILIAFVSCEGDIFGTITNFMDQTSQNVLVSSGMVTVDTAQVDAVADSVSTVVALNTNQPATFDSTDPSFDQAAVDAYNEDFAAAVEETKTELKEVLESPAKIEELKEQLSAPVAAADVPVKITEAVEDIETELGIDIEINTEADLLVATLIVSVMDNPTFAALTDGDDTNDGDVTEEDIAAMVSDALQVVEVVKALSPTGAIELDTAVNDLLNSFLGGEDRAVSRVEVVDDGEDWGAILSDYIVPIINPVLDAMDTSGNGIIEESELRAMVRDYGVMRRGYERMAPGLVRGDGTIRNQKKLSDLINYALSVIFSSGRTLLDGYTVPTTDNDFLEFLRDVQDYLAAYEDDPEADFDSYIDTTFISTSIEDNYNTVLTNHGDTIGYTLLNISSAIPKNTMITELIQDYLAELQ